MRQRLSVPLAVAVGVLSWAQEAWSQTPSYRFTSIAPCRLTDTRLPSPGNPLAHLEARTFNVYNQCGIPAGVDALDPNRAAALFVNVTAVLPTGEGHLRIYDGSLTSPVNTSVVNFLAGAFATGNGALVNVSGAGQIKVYAFVAGPGTVHVTLDVLGYYTGVAGGQLHFFGLPACRLLDTRNPDTYDGGFGGGPILTTNLTRSVKVQGRCGVPPGATAATTTLTVVTPSAAGHLVAYPRGTSPPVASAINFPAGILARANGTILPLGTPDGQGYDLSLLPYVGPTGTAHVLLDVTGYYKAQP